MPPSRSAWLLFLVAVTAGCGPAAGSLAGSGVGPLPASETAEPGGTGNCAAHVETDNALSFAESLGEGGISDRPFTGPANNGLIGLGGVPLGLFSRAGRDALIAPGDDVAGAAQEPPALAWLAVRQAADGGWEEGQSDGAETSNDPELTGRVLLAFLAAGQTHRGRHAFARVVARGLRFLKNRQGPEGWFGVGSGGGGERDLRRHVPACAAMVEAYAQTRSPIFKTSARRGLGALAAACAVEDPALWDTTIAYGSLLALLSARRVDRDSVRLGRDAPFGVTSEGFAPLARRRTPPGWAEAEDVALAVLARCVFDDVETVEAQADLLDLAGGMAVGPWVWDAGVPGMGPAIWPLVHAALEVAPEGGGARRREDTRRLLFANQAGVDSWEALRGSWDPSRLPGYRAGRIRLTTLCLASLWRIR